ncbi:unnamed protein product [Arctogadus glacialis]
MRHVPFSIVGEHLAASLSSSSPSHPLILFPVPRCVHMLVVLGAQAGGTWQYKAPALQPGEGYNEALALIQEGPQEAGERAAVQGPRAQPLPLERSGGPPRYHHVSLDGFS